MGNRERQSGAKVQYVVITKVAYAVGTVLWWKEREIEVVRNDVSSGHSPCLDCVLQNSRTCHFAVECRAEKRKDGIGVHFENVRKEERI